MSETLEQSPEKKVPPVFGKVVRFSEETFQLYLKNHPSYNKGNGWGFTGDTKEDFLVILAKEEYEKLQFDVLIHTIDEDFESNGSGCDILLAKNGIFFEVNLGLVFEESEDSDGRDEFGKDDHHFLLKEPQPLSKDSESGLLGKYILSKLSFEQQTQMARQFASGE